MSQLQLEFAQSFGNRPAAVQSCNHPQMLKSMGRNKKHANQTVEIVACKKLFIKSEIISFNENLIMYWTIFVKITFHQCMGWASLQFWKVANFWCEDLFKERYWGTMLSQLTNVILNTKKLTCQYFSNLFVGFIFYTNLLPSLFFSSWHFCNC